MVLRLWGADESGEAALREKAGLTLRSDAQKLP